MVVHAGDSGHRHGAKVENPRDTLPRRCRSRLHGRHVRGGPCGIQLRRLGIPDAVSGADNTALRRQAGVGGGLTRFDTLRTRQLLALLFGALAIAARLPFLITGKIPFDSDEAVQGLMARHVLLGELPVFFWGQPFKGVPEVYAAAGAFAVFGSSVTALKSVTLAVFAMYVALNFVLLDKIASRWVAVSASLLLIVAPPALVFWSLWAGAEYMFIMLLGTLLLLMLER